LAIRETEHRLEGIEDTLMIETRGGQLGAGHGRGCDGGLVAGELPSWSCSKVSSLSLPTKGAINARHLSTTRHQAPRPKSKDQTDWARQAQQYGEPCVMAGHASVNRPSFDG
jgi:hypothetical protein